ncbi:MULTISPECIES: hypothetical protein [unclassified Nocardioides]|jgi:hypothetical protein|uniref:hypothetical protein n=1 Tax=Nocardioides sp. URHA0032 TaxID=1380388 RepID=UPI000AA76913|nr:hypothetical protein [Nocardioides sp. URHA0032]
MVVWIVIAAVVVALAVFAFWPRQRGIVDDDVRRLKRDAAAGGQNGSNRSNPQFNGPL